MRCGDDNDTSRVVRAQAIAIGASAGGVEALSAITSKLPADFAVPILVAIHLPPDRKSVLPALLDESSAVSVVEAEDKVSIEPGGVYFSPPDYHLLVERDGRMSLSSDEPVRFSRPSIDVLFESAADAYGEGLLGVVLTGANDDGARGLKAICAAGGTAWVQRPDDAYASAMPAAAISRCPSARVLGLDELADALSSVEPWSEEGD